MPICRVCKGTGRIIYAPSTCGTGGEAACYGCGGEGSSYWVPAVFVPPTWPK